MLAALIGAGLLMASQAHAGTDVTAILDAATTTFTGVATLCVTIGTFFIGYRLVKRAK